MVQNCDRSPSLLLQYNTSTLSEGHASNLTGTIAQTVSSFMGKVDLVKDISLLSAKSYEEILIWNNKSWPEIQYTSVLDIIHDQVLLRHTKLAISSWDGNLSYGKLDELSSKLSEHLTSLGVGPGNIIPTCFEKSMWAVVATLAVMKSGAAFAPLDPALPAQRLKVSLRSLQLKHKTYSSLNRAHEIDFLSPKQEPLRSIFGT